MRSLFLLILGLFLISPLSAQAISVGDSLGLSPFWDWRTIDTPNFRITYPKEIEVHAQKVAQYYEEAQRVLGEELHWQPTKKVNVLLTDNTDAANGMTTPVLRFGMILYIIPPEPYFSTTYYDDWLKLLVFHEYTHFLNMDPTRGVYAFFRFILGDVFMPNSLWPAWMLEGLAVYMETKYSTHGGRGRSPYWEMVLRAAVEANKLDHSSWVTLDQINGPHPWHPGGETRYLFGYQLMNEVSKTDPKALGEMSLRSSWRVPYFINGNLENITGKDWYTFWDEWVARTRKKANADLEKIRSKPVTTAEIIDGTHYETLGSALSPQERFLAYGHRDEDRWETLKVKDLKTGETNTIEDKFFGVGMAFTPDGRQLVYSSMHRTGNYYFYSDLKAYDVVKDQTYWLTKDARARDPDVSRDGNWVIFTVAQNSATHLQIGKLKRNGDRLSLVEQRRLVTAEGLDRIGNPKFSPDQKEIYFSFKKNGTPGERLMRYSFATGKTETLLADSTHYFRYPAFDREGNLHFVSDLSGVDNLYRWSALAPEVTPKNSAKAKGKKPQTPAAAPSARTGSFTQVTNFTSGVILPTFGKKDLYASVYTWEGWGLGRVPLSQLAPVETTAVTISPAEAPPSTKSAPDTTIYESKEYTPWESLLPRQWAPVVLLTEDQGKYVGGQVAGFDQTHQHQYALGLAYEFEVGTFDHLILYQNRSFGVNIDLFTSSRTKDLEIDTNVSPQRKTYTIDRDAGAQVSFPFQFTTSVFEPALGVGFERDEDFERLGDGPKRSLRKSRLVPTQDLTLRYADTRASPLGVTQERGRNITLGVRRYDDSEIENYKLLAKYTEYLHLGNHWVLVPSVRGMKVSRENPRFRDANAVLDGDREAFYNRLPSDNYDELGVRGYPSLLVLEKEVYVGSIDLRLPLWQIFRGWGTNPAFLNQLSLGVFGENAYIPSFSSSVRNLYSAGSSLNLSTQWLNLIPLTFSLEYQKGFVERARGEDTVFFSINTNLLPFDF